MKEKKEINIRFSKLQDKDFLLECLSQEDVRKWYPPSTKSDVVAFIHNWIGFARIKSSLTAFYSDPEEIVGVATIMLMPYMKVRHLALMYMVVSPKHYRQGIGNALVKNLKHLAKNRFSLESLHCELWEGCLCLPLLKKHGFYVVFKQDKFVNMDGKFCSRILVESKL